MSDEAREKQIRNCKHCFALIKEGGWSGGFHSSDYEYDEDIIECVKCGLTNKNIEIEKRYSHIFRPSIESKLFPELVYNHKYSRVPFMLQDLNMLSNKEIGTKEPRKLWYIAKEVELSLDIEYPECYPLIFDTIQKLIKLAKENNLFLMTLDSCYQLMDVYNKNRKYEKEIK